MRIIVKAQSDLWADGVRAGAILGDAVTAENLDEAEDVTTRTKKERSNRQKCRDEWYLMAKDERGTAPANGGDTSAPGHLFRHHAALRQAVCRPWAKLPTIRFGVKTGCDAFFMPKDITAEMLAKHDSDRAFREHAAAHRGKTLKLASCGSSRPATEACIPSRPSIWLRNRTG